MSISQEEMKNMILRQYGLPINTEVYCVLLNDKHYLSIPSTNTRIELTQLQWNTLMGKQS